jgi:hypothetical protein
MANGFLGRIAALIAAKDTARQTGPFAAREFAFRLLLCPRKAFPRRRLN